MDDIIKQMYAERKSYYMHRLSSLEAPALAGVIREKSVRGAIAEIKNCMYDGADMIDLHMSCLEESDVENLRKIIQSTRLPVLALNYNNTYEWKDAGLSEEERIDSFLRAAKAGAAGVDIQGYTYDITSKSGYVGKKQYSFTKGNPKEIVTDETIISKQCELFERVHSMGAEVLLSCHPGIPMSCEQVVELALYLENRKPDLIKIVTRADDQNDLLESIKTMMTLKKEIETPISYHVNGPTGSLSRILNPVLGGQIAFCVDHYNEGSTMEQIDLRMAKNVVENIKKLL